MGKVCDYCGKEGAAYTFWRAISYETICPVCLKELPTDSMAGRRMVYDLRAALTTAREENERLKDWLGNLLAVMHRDGGHYQIEHGTGKAVEDAIALWAENVVRVEALSAENAALRAATRGKTFSHSDEEVNAEMGRLRAKVEELSTRPLDQIIRAVMAHGYSCEEAADILSDYLHRREKRRQANALKEPQ